MRMYERTDDRGTALVPFTEGTAAINYAMVGGKRFVDEMIQIASRSFEITYTNGRTVRWMAVDVKD
jgi:hypothetical protein